MIVAALAGVYVMSGSSATNTRFMDGYPLDNSPSAAAAFPGNEIIVLAEVESILEPQWNTASRTEPGSLAFIFTPIRVKVLEVLRGAPRLQDGSLIIRHLGGRIGQDEFVAAEEISPRGLVPGARTLLFLGEQRDLGDGLDATTPNMAYIVDDTGAARSSDGQWSIELGAFRALLRP